MSDGVTLREFAEYVSEASDMGATFFSEVFDEISKGAISEAQKLTEAADALKRDFQRFSETAAKYAVKSKGPGSKIKGARVELISSSM